MLAKPSFEPPRLTRFVNLAKTVPKFFAGSLDGGRIYEAAINELPEALRTVRDKICDVVKFDCQSKYIIRSWTHQCDSLIIGI